MTGADDTPPGRRRARRWPVRLLAAALALPLAAGAACGGWAGYLRLTHNVHEFEPGVFRSGQLPGVTLTALIREKGIRTVLNLRGENPGKPWYDAENAAIAGAGAELVNIPLSANHDPDPATLGRLAAALDAAKTPFLLHCEAGADRSGLAAAMYEVLVAHRSVDVARGQLSFAYGHFPWLLSRSGAMDRAFERVVERR